MNLFFDLPPALFVSAFILFALLVFVLEILLIRFVFRKLNISMTGGMPKSVWKIISKNILATTLLLFGTLGLLTLVFVKVFHQPLNNSIAYSFGIYWVIVFAFVLKKWIESREQHGQIVMEIASGPVNKNAFFINVPVYIALGFVVNFIYGLTSCAQFVAIVVGVSMALFNILFAMGKLQIYENGILAYIVLYKWKDIESYRWDKGNEKFVPLRIRIGGRLPAFLRNGALMIPVEKKDEVEKLLFLYLPNLLPETEKVN